MTKHVLVIGGGQNAEHSVSVKTAAAIVEALRSGGFDVSTITIGRDGTWSDGTRALGTSAATSLAAALPLLEQVDVVFPAVHGPRGEDGTLAALCALVQKPVAGSGLRAGAIGMDKWATKLIAEAIGIRTASGRLVRAAQMADIEFVADVVVKPVSGGSGNGVTLARDAVQLHKALRLAARYDDQILVEHVVHGREIQVAVLLEAGGSSWAPPPLEVHAGDVRDTATTFDGTEEFTVPARLDSTDSAMLTQAALALFDALGCAGVARFDFFLTDNGPVLNEVNTTPGMTVESTLPEMFAAAGVSYEDLVARLVSAASMPTTVLPLLVNCRH